MTDKEKKTLQIIRGLALMMVVLHHVLRANGNTQYDNCIYLLSYIHVQTFFFISGFLYEWNSNRYRKTGVVEFAAKKTRELVIPYFAWTWLLSGLIILTKAVSVGAYGILESKGYIAKNLQDVFIDPLLFRNPYFESLWFVYVLYVLFAINWLISSKHVNKYYFVISVIVASCYTFFCYETSPFIVRQVVKSFQWFYFGRLCVFYKKRLIQYSNSNKIKFMTIVVFILLSVLMLQDPVGKYIENKAGRACLYCIERTLFTLCGIHVIYILADLLYRKTEEIASIFGFIGDKSYGIYLIHNPWIVTPVSLVLSKFLPTNVLTESIIFSIVFIFSLLVCLCIEKNAFISNIFLGIKRDYIKTRN